MKRLRATALTVDVLESDGTPCLRLEGEADEQGAALIEEALDRLLHTGSLRVIVDTRHLLFLNAECCEALENGIRLLEEEGGAAVIVDGSLPVERTLKLLDLAGHLPVASTVRQALAYLEDNRS